MISNLGYLASPFWNNYFYGMALRQRQAIIGDIIFFTILFGVDLLWDGGHSLLFNIVKDVVLSIGFGYMNYKMWRSNDAYAERVSLPPLELGEHIIYEGPASHYNLSNGFQGKLFLTDKRLIFLPIDVFRPKEEVIVSREDIIGSVKRSPIDILNVKLIIHKASGKKEKFVVQDRRQWVAAFNMQSIQS